MTISEYLNKLYKYSGGVQEELILTVEETDERIEVSIELPEEEVSLFIGSYGETLESLETILRSVFHRDYADKKIIVDINEYKKRKEEKLINNALEIAFQVLDTGRPYVFGYLNSYERYLIHKAISSNSKLSEVETFSEDEESGRILVIQVKDDNTESNNNADLDLEEDVDDFNEELVETEE